MRGSYKRIPRLTVAEHVALGNRIKDAWNTIGSIICSHPQNSRTVRAARSIERHLNTVKSELDNEVCALVPRPSDRRGLATRVYYGPKLAPRQPVDGNDVFDEWERAFGTRVADE